MSIEKTNLLIGGKICPPESGQYYSLHSPVDGTLVAEVADANQADVDRAASAAHEAFYREWKFCDTERKRALFAKLKEVLHAMADELAAAKVQPQGGKGIPPLVDRVIDYYMSKLDNGAGELIEHSDQRTNYVLKEPLGVVAVFAPFNGPMLGALLSVVPALVAGNTVILKTPDQEAPQALKTMQAFHEAGFPAGVVNALNGKGPEVGQALVKHPAVRLISFTGSTATGKKIMASAAEDLKRVQLNLGNKTAQIIFPDADLEAAATATVGSAFPGQACSAISRILLHESVHDEIFGPVVSVLTFDSDDEALALANDTDYGLLVSLWTQDSKRQRYLARRLDVGIVAINSGSALSHRTPWGGFKQSGIGRRYGELGLEPFFEYKTVWIS